MEGFHIVFIYHLPEYLQLFINKLTTYCFFNKKNLTHCHQTVSQQDILTYFSTDNLNRTASMNLLLYVHMYCPLDLHQRKYTEMCILVRFCSSLMMEWPSRTNSYINGYMICFLQLKPHLISSILFLSCQVFLVFQKLW